MGFCLSGDGEGRQRNFFSAGRVGLVFMPFLGAWEEVTVTCQPRNSAKKLRAVGLCPASFLEVSEHCLDIKSWSLKEEARYNIVSKGRGTSCEGLS